MADQNDIDARLAALAGATEPLRPRTGFSARVMAAVAAEPSSILDDLWRPSRRLIPLAAMAALAAVVWAVQIEGTVNEAMAVSYGAVEASW